MLWISIDLWGSGLVGFGWVRVLRDWSNWRVYVVIVDVGRNWKGM